MINIVKSPDYIVKSPDYILKKLKCFSCFCLNVY